MLIQKDFLIDLFEVADREASTVEEAVGLLDLVEALVPQLDQGLVVKDVLDVEGLFPVGLRREEEALGSVGLPYFHLPLLRAN